MQRILRACSSPILPSLALAKTKYTSGGLNHYGQMEPQLLRLFSVRFIPIMTIPRFPLSIAHCPCPLSIVHCSIRIPEVQKHSICIVDLVHVCKSAHPLLSNKNTCTSKSCISLRSYRTNNRSKLPVTGCHVSAGPSAVLLSLYFCTPQPLFFPSVLYMQQTHLHFPVFLQSSCPVACGLCLRPVLPLVCPVSGLSCTWPVICVLPLVKAVFFHVIFVITYLFGIVSFDVGSLFL